jgi:hypothetical protein
MPHISTILEPRAADRLFRPERRLAAEIGGQQTGIRFQWTGEFFLDKIQATS